MIWRSWKAAHIIGCQEIKWLFTSSVKSLFECFGSSLLGWHFETSFVATSLQKHLRMPSVPVVFVLYMFTEQKGLRTWRIHEELYHSCIKINPKKIYRNASIHDKPWHDTSYAMDVAYDSDYISNCTPTKSYSNHWHFQSVEEMWGNYQPTLYIIT